MAEQCFNIRLEPWYKHQKKNNVNNNEHQQIRVPPAKKMMLNPKNDGNGFACVPAPVVGFWMILEPLPFHCGSRSLRPGPFSQWISCRISHPFLPHPPLPGFLLLFFCTFLNMLMTGGRSDDIDIYVSWHFPLFIVVPPQ